MKTIYNIALFLFFASLFYFIYYVVSKSRNKIHYSYGLNEDATKVKITFYVFSKGKIVYSNYMHEGYISIDSIDIVKEQIEKDWKNKIKKLKF